MKIIILIIALMLSGCQVQEKPKQVKKPTTQIQVNDKTNYQYHYQFLTKKQKQLYDDLYQIIINVDDYGNIKNLNEKDFKVVYKAMLYDHPEIFYLDAEITYTKNRVMPKYKYSKKEIKEYQEKISQEIKKIKKEISNKNQYDQLIYVYTYIIEHTKYNINAEENQSVISSMINHETVCTGYAKMTQLILKELGYKVTTIVGTAFDANQVSQTHAWNMIEFEGDYYYIDSTWGDQENIETPYTSFEYFMMTSQDMEKVYQADGHYEKTKDHKWNYYVYQNLYIKEYNSEEIANRIDINKNWIELKFSDNAYDQALQQMKISNEFFNILRGKGIHIGKITYTENNYFKVIRIMW